MPKPQAPQVEAEYIPVEGFETEEVTELAPLRIETPLEQWKNLFDRMGDIRKKLILWEEKTVIKSPKTRDEAIQLRTLATRTAKMIDEARLNGQKEIRDYIEKMNGYCKEAIVPLIGTKEAPGQGVAGRLTEKISAYAEECLRLEEEMKQKALAEQRRIEEEIRAKEEEAKIKEEAIRQEEELRLRHIEEEAFKKAQEGGHTETDQMMADLAREEEQARIDAERAERERKLEEQRIENQRLQDEADRKLANDMAQATAKGKVKGVQEIWSIELIDEELLDKKFMVYDESKARAALKNGFYNKKEKDAEKLIPGLRCVVVLGKGGK